MEFRRVLFRSCRKYGRGYSSAGRPTPPGASLCGRPRSRRDGRLCLRSTLSGNDTRGDDSRRTDFRYLTLRSEERRVGKECRSRGAPYHLKKNRKSAVEEGDLQEKMNINNRKVRIYESIGGYSFM